MAPDPDPPSEAAVRGRAKRLVAAIGIAQLALLLASPFVVADAEHVSVKTAWLALAPSVAVCALALVGVLWAGYFLLAGRTVPDWSLSAPMVLPVLAGTIAFRLRLPGSATQAGSESVTRSVSVALDALGVASFGAALVLGAAAMLLAMRAALRSKPLRIDRTTVVALVTAGVGSIALAMSLRGGTALFVVAPITFSVIALGVSGAALASPPLRRISDPDPTPSMAMDGLTACLLSVGAVTLAACAFGATSVASDFARSLAAAAADRVSGIEAGWADSIGQTRRAGLCALMFAAGGVVVFGQRVRVLGLGLPPRLSNLAVGAVAILASVALLRSEVTRAGRAVARSWSAPEVSGVVLSEVRAFAASSSLSVDRALVVGKARIRQRDKDLGDVKELDSPASCRALAERVDHTGAEPLGIALDAETPFARASCLAVALATRANAPLCKLSWLAMPEARAAARKLPPLDTLKPRPVAVDTEVSGIGSCPRLEARSLEVAGTVWTHERADGSFEERSGGARELEEWAHVSLAGKTVALGAKPELPVERVLSVAALIASDQGRVVLAPVEGHEPPPPPPPAKKHRVRLGQPTSCGVADLPKVSSIVTSRRQKLEACYEEGLMRSPTLGGPLVVRFSLQQDGNVSQAISGTANFADPKTAECIVAVFKNTAFPPPLGGGATVFFPLTLDPSPSPDSASDTDADGGAPGQLQIEFDKVTVSGMLVPTEVQSRIEKIRPTVERCAERASGVPLDGVLSVRFTIGPEGGVSNVVADNETKIPSGVAGCIYSALYQIGFPRPTEASVSVTAPIRFHQTAP
jgi:hypothetical protein